MADFDLLVIGAGPAGYVASIRAAQLGFKVACVDEKSSLGGTCLNIGCIPSKALLHSSELFEKLNSNKLDELGIHTNKPKLNLEKMMDKKNNIVQNLTKGIDFLFKKNNVTRFFGKATILDSNKVEVKNNSNTEVISCKKILISTGSKVSPLKGVDIDEKTIVSSTGALSLKKVPEDLIIIGAGYIGLEMGTVWRRLGANVTVIEYLDRILPGMDLEIAKKFKSILEKQGINFMLNTAVINSHNFKTEVELELKNSNKELSKIKSDIVLVSTGRSPNTDNLGLEKIGVSVDSKGFIKVNNMFETNIKNIFAVGDVIPGPMLAHKAEEDGVAAVEIMAGIHGHVDYEKVPGIVYTSPEVATLGKTEEFLKDNKISFSKGIFPFSANSRARAIDHTDGFVKILSDKITDKILGVHIIGHEAGTLIHEVSAVMAFGGSSEDLARTCHGHPTLNEAVKEAALAVGSGAIHI